MIIFFKVLHFCFQLVYENIFILDECTGLANLSHQFNYKFNVVLIFKLYFFRFFFQFFNGMADFIQIVFATSFYAVSVIYLPHILFWASISLILYLSTILFLSMRIFSIWLLVFCEYFPIIWISRCIKASFCIFGINLGHSLTLHNNFVFLFLAVLGTRLPFNQT